MIGKLALFAAIAATGMTDESAVVFREDFEDFRRSRWDDLGRSPEALEVVDGGLFGGKCLQITATAGENTGAHLYKMLDPGLDDCYLRFYVKFDKEAGYIHHFVHLVGYRPATRWPQGGAGSIPAGDRRFSTGIEPWGDWGRHPAPGAWHFYSYWCEMKAAPDGRYWGNSFAPAEPALVPRDRWICVEIQLKCNAPDASDGEQVLWIDGREEARFEGIRWRTHPELQVNGVWIMHYVTEQAARHNKVDDPPETNTVWFDEIVVSRQPIGPARRPDR